MTLDQAKQIKRTAAALARAEGLLKTAALDANVQAAAEVYLNAKRAHEQAVTAAET